MNYIIHITQNDFSQDKGKWEVLDNRYVTVMITCNLIIINMTLL